MRLLLDWLLLAACPTGADCAVPVSLPPIWLPPCEPCMLAAPPLLALSYLVEGPLAWQLAASRFNGHALLAVLFQSYANTLLGFGIWTMLMKKYATATIAPFSLLVPVAGMLSAALVLGEPLQWWKLAAGVLVLGGLALNLFGGRLWAMATATR